MQQIIETQRLILREFTLQDSGFIIELVNSPDWIEFIGDRNIKTDIEARAYLQNGPIKSYRDNGFGLAMVETKEDNFPIGMCGIIKRDSLDHPDIGFAFLSEFTGHGYGFEIASATLNYAKTKLLLQEILAITVPHNIKSIKLLEKTGMTFVKKFRSQDGEEELLLYRG